MPLPSQSNIKKHKIMFTDLENQLKSLCAAYPKVFRFDIAIVSSEIEYNVLFFHPVNSQPVKFTSMLEMLDYLDTND